MKSSTPASPDPAKSAQSAAPPLPPLPQLRRRQLAVAALFLVLGFNFSTWGARIPALKAQLGLNSAQVGFLLLAGGLGAVASFPFTATLLQRLGSRKLCVLAGLLLPLNLLALALAPNLPLALVVMVLEGLIVSLLNVAMNAQGVVVETLGQQAIMSRLHAVFSLGGLLAALFASALLALSDSLILHFALSAGLMWALCALALPSLLTEQSRPRPAPALPGQHSLVKLFAHINPQALWLGVIVLCGTVVENSMSDWSALYLQERVKVSAELAPLGIAFVSGAMVLARWLGDGWRTRWGAARLLPFGGVLAGCGLSVALLLGSLPAALIGFALVGLGIAAVSPCTYAEAAKNGPLALASVTTMGSIGGLAGPPLIGAIAHASHYGWGMAVIALAAFLVALAARRVQWS